MKASEVLNSKWETMPEISKAVGMAPAELWPIVKGFIEAGHAEIATWQHSGCSVPMIRLRPGIFPTWKKRGGK
jgi:hypothetical protein